MSQPSYQYPHVEIDLGKLKENLAALQERCQASSIEISGVVKGFHALPAAAKVYEEVGVSSIASSRMDQLRGLKEAGIRTPLMLIRIPMPSEVEDVVTWSDISLNSECSVLRLLDEAARNKGKTHKVILMVDLGDLREGFWDWDELVAAALEVEHDLPTWNCWAWAQPGVLWLYPGHSGKNARPGGGCRAGGESHRTEAGGHLRRRVFLPSYGAGRYHAAPHQPPAGGGGHPPGQHLGLQYGLYAQGHYGPPGAGH